MRIVFGLMGLVVVLAIVGILSKKQLGAVSNIKVPQTTDVPMAVDTNASVKAQSQQIQNQVKQQLENAMQQARPEPQEK
jgi:F0F1-type ATP synthase membrane subunit b/b'